jgi:hypothetical protein
MKTPEITCECCGGTGRRPLSPAYWHTLQILRKTGREGASATEVHAKIDRSLEIIEVTAVNNRLSALTRMGFAVVRQKKGKTLIYAAA